MLQIYGKDDRLLDSVNGLYEIEAAETLCLRRDRFTTLALNAFFKCKSEYERSQRRPKFLVLPCFMNSVEFEPFGRIKSRKRNGKKVLQLTLQVLDVTSGSCLHKIENGTILGHFFEMKSWIRGPNSKFVSCF